MASYPHLDFNDREKEVPTLKKLQILNELDLDSYGYEYTHLKLRYNKIELFDNLFIKLDLFGHTLRSAFYDVARIYS